MQQQAHDETIRRLLGSANDMIGESFAVLQMCPGMLSFLPFTAQSHFENNCENSIVMISTSIGVWNPKSLLRRCLGVQTPTQYVFRWMSRD